MPEQVLVLETIGTIENFLNVAKYVDGWEALGDFEIAGIEPDYGFEDTTNSDKPLNGQLFLIMTDQRALQEMQSLFNQWQRYPYENFPYGRNRLKTAFAHLRSIRPWGAEDRIGDTHLLEEWRFQLENQDTSIYFEAELWYRMSPNRRRQAERYIRQIITRLDGEVVQQCEIPR